MEVGGVADESAGEAVRIHGKILKVVENRGQHWFCVSFGRDNVLVLTPYLVQVIDHVPLLALGLDIASFEVFAIKSRVHFRRGFHDNAFARTILLVEPTEPFLGTVRLDKLPYKNVDLLPLRKSDLSGVVDVSPHPEEHCEAMRLEGCRPESQPRSKRLGLALRDAPPRGAPQGEGLKLAESVSYSRSRAASTTRDVRFPPSCSSSPAPRPS
jgi:hypothetical protein